MHLYLAIVNGLIAYVTKGSLNSSVNNAKATIAATKADGAAAVSAQQLAEALALLNKSKVLGKTVAIWFEKNLEAIIEFRGRKSRPPETVKPPEPSMSPSQLKKMKEEQELSTGQKSSTGNNSGSISDVGANSAATGSQFLRGIDPSDLYGTHSLSGSRSSASVDKIAASMRADGFKGPPIDVIEQNGKFYILDGHHRAAAAARTGTNVDIRIVQDIGSHPSNFQSIDDVIRAAEQVGPNRLVPKDKYKK